MQKQHNQIRAAVTDGFVKDREVILFDNAGIASSSGEVPTAFEDVGANAIAFIKALGLTKSTCLAFRSAALLVRKSHSGGNRCV